MKLLFTSAFFFLSIFLFAQLPECDIFLLDIKDSAGQISFRNPVNITQRKGYDNQPAFSPDGKYLLYSSQKDSAGPTDIFKYDLKTKKISQVTKTPTSEYSPTFMPDGKNFSVVMVEADSTQRLWRFPLAGGEPACIMKNVVQVGYHTWINKDSVALFILTKPSFTLQIFNIALQKPALVTDSIGRCMRMKNGKLWFTTKASAFNNVFELSFSDKRATLLGMQESEDYCFYGKDQVWSVSENSIVSGFMNSKEGAAELADLSKFGITKPTRLVVSPDGKKLAVVSNK
jgi:WD40 repeat protein